MSATGFLSYVNSQMAAGAYPTWNRPGAVRRAVTISRQAGCGALEIGEKLAARLQARGPDHGCPWTVFDHNLMEKVLEDHRLPKYLATYLPEDRKPAMEEILEDIFGLHPPESTIIKQTAETILGLAEMGNVILIGRGGNIITAQVPHVLHVRIVAPLEQRIQHAHKTYGNSEVEARNFCLREDLGRERYVCKHFHADINNPLLYHLVINTGLMSYDAAAMLIEEALLSLQTLPKNGAGPAAPAHVAAQSAVAGAAH
jgi:cytidylate kinase